MHGTPCMHRSPTYSHMHVTVLLLADENLDCFTKTKHYESMK